jgi:hypothetical protein
MAQFPRSHGDGFQIVPGAVGHSAALTDNPSFREIYVDRDLSHWGARASSDAQHARHVRHGRPDRHTPTHDRAAELVDRFTGAWTNDAPAASPKALVHAHGSRSGQLYYAWKRGPNVNNADANWQWKAPLDRRHGRRLLRQREPTRRRPGHGT